MEKPVTKAFEEGRLAFQLGQRNADNPYADAFSAKFLAWQVGYCIELEAVMFQREED